MDFTNNFIYNGKNMAQHLQNDFIVIMKLKNYTFFINIK